MAFNLSKQTEIVLEDVDAKQCTSEYFDGYAVLVEGEIDRLRNCNLHPKAHIAITYISHQNNKSVRTILSATTDCHD